jgi:hypothetical protein
MFFLLPKLLGCLPEPVFGLAFLFALFVVLPVVDLVLVCAGVLVVLVIENKSKFRVKKKSFDKKILLNSISPCAIVKSLLSLSNLCRSN